MCGRPAFFKCQVTLILKSYMLSFAGAADPNRAVVMAAFEILPAQRRSTGCLATKPASPVTVTPLSIEYSLHTFIYIECAEETEPTGLPFRPTNQQNICAIAQALYTALTCNIRNERQRKKQSYLSGSSQGPRPSRSALQIGTKVCGLTRGEPPENTCEQRLACKQLMPLL